MKIDSSTRQIYTCPRCRIDTPHEVLTRRGAIFAVMCVNCKMSSLVREDDLLHCNNRWADELRTILSSLEDQDDH